MNSSPEIDKLMEALVKARKKIGAVTKSGRNEHDRYNYAKLEDYVKATDESLLESGLSVITSTHELREGGNRTTKGGAVMNAVYVCLSLRLCHVSGQWIEVEQWGEGEDRSDKATYKAVTGARKYGIANLLGLFTTDDAENDVHEKSAIDRSAAPSRTASSLV